VTPHAPSRRELFAAAAALGFGSATFHRAVAATAAAADPPGTVTPEMIKNAEWVAGVELTDAQRKAAAAGMTGALRDFAALHKVKVGNDVAPALYFNPDPGAAERLSPRPQPAELPAGEIARPEADDDLAFLPLASLARLIRDRKLSSTELTKLCLVRLHKYDPALKCVVTFTDDLALKQAKQADDEIAAGKYRGPLHGIPWAAKDLIAYPGFKTTWGAGQFKEQVLDGKAEVAARLEAAGCVMACKTTLGALASGDVWFGGKTRSPWDVKQGSSGSSAGSAAAVAAGLVGFGIGSETYGSIVSPSRQCGVTGLRPTFGRVSRHNCMTLCWSMDKVGPLARSAEDCALVFAAIHGHDPKDPTTTTRPFEWPCRTPLKEIRVGYFEGNGDDDREELRVLKEAGAKLVPVTLPSELPVGALLLILTVEASAAFDDLTRAGTLDEVGAFWPGAFRRGRFVPAVEYLRAQRVRTLVMKVMAELFEKVDVYIGGNTLLTTNLTGHPSVAVPTGVRKGSPIPGQLVFTGRLWGEAELLAVAKAYQDATGHNLKRPDMSKVTKEAAEGK
jgi:Asp-tRNA(Asn)/Glu-tRNA(Gln) amidotransferase A subunit family amidase